MSAERDRQQGGAVERLQALERGTTALEAIAFFDSLPPVRVEEMIGFWRGRGIPTGSPLDGMLERFGWHGKRFGNAEEADPLLFDDGHGAFVCINLALLPTKLLVRAPQFLNSQVVARLFRLVRPLLVTRRPAARLRMMEHRGVVTATMIYDAAPIIDAFRRIDDDTVLGVMDLRGLEEPFVFSLRREQ